MDPFMFYTVASLILLVTLQTRGDQLAKPTLLAITERSEDVIMVGDTFIFSCQTAQAGANRFILECQPQNSSVEQTTSNFTIVGVTLNNNCKYYTCRYCVQTSCSEPSDSFTLYVRETFPPPKICAYPRKIVQPGDPVTIKCSSPYEDVNFSLYKDNRLVVEDGKNASIFYYKIKETHERDAGHYMCRFTKSMANNLQLQSDPSDPLHIRVKDLHKPIISGETNSFDSESLQIHCTAPPTQDKRIWFRLISERNNTEQEINDVQSRNVTFFIKDPRHWENKYYCDYRLRYGNDFALSKVSNAAIIRSAQNDHTAANIVRLILAALVLLATAAITFNHIITLHRSVALERLSHNVTFTMQSEVITMGQTPGNEYID